MKVSGDPMAELPSTSVPSTSSAAPRREPNLESLMELTRSLASREDIFDILFSVVSQCSNLLEVDRSSIVLRNKDVRGDGASSADESLTVVASSDDATLRHRDLSLRRYPEIERVLTSRQPLVIRDVSQSPLFAEVLESRGSLDFSSMMLVPIVVGDDPLAVLVLKSAQKADFGEDDILHARAVANATAIALSNARLVSQLRDQTRALFSAQTHQEQKLKELSRYLDIFESSRDAMLVMNQEGVILFANPRASQLLGCKAGALVGGSFRDLVVADEATDELLAGFSRGQFPSGLDFHLRAERPHTIVSANFADMPGEHGAVLATMRDVTAERRLARELANTKEFLERVIESSVDGIVSANLRGTVLVYNGAASRIFGYSREEVVGKLRVDRLYPPGGARDIMQRIRSHDHSGPGRLVEERVDLLTKSGEHVPVNLSASLVLDGDRPVGTVGIFTDIRAQMAMESQLEEARRQLQNRERQDAIAEVAGAAAHELNQPLTSVMGYAEYLRRAVAEDENLARAADVILTETERMADIVRQVGRITRYETKPYVGGTKIVDLERSSMDPDEPSSR